MKRVLFLACLLTPLFASAADPSPKDLLATAFERVDGDDEHFQPYQFIYEVHSFVRDGDDELEEEDLERGRITGFSPDSTKTELLEKRKIGGGDETEEETSAEDENDETGSELPEFDKEFRRHHEFRFSEWTELDGRRAALYKIHPEKKKKEYWKGRVWIDPAQGAILAVELEPAKRPFGLRSMNINARYFDFEGRDLPTRMDVSFEIKVPIIVHKKIKVEMRFCDFVLLGK